MTHPTSPPPPPGPKVRPLATEQRVDRYRRQNGSDTLTARQQRRIRHKANRTLARVAA